MEIYPGVDLVFYGKGGNLEYDLVIGPGADPRLIRFDLHGAKGIRLAREGGLVIPTEAGEVRWKAPVIYQKSAQGRQGISGRFTVRGRRVRFELGEYDRGSTLVIDPALAYASFFGAPPVLGLGYEGSGGVAVDGAGNVYVAGITASSDLPVTAGVVQTAFGGYSANLRYFVGDAFVSKFTPGGVVAWVTYLGGKGDDGAAVVTVDGAGNVYLAGVTNSTDFPVTAGVLQPALKGTGGNACVRFGDAFVAKLNPSGSQLIYSTYLGGQDDFATAMASIPGGTFTLAGATMSRDFPTLNAAQNTFHGAGGEPGRPSCNDAPLFDGGDAFVAKLNANATALVFSTYLGGSRDDVALALGIDPSQNVLHRRLHAILRFPRDERRTPNGLSRDRSAKRFFQYGRRISG
jgi:hypothetical protein